MLGYKDKWDLHCIYADVICKCKKKTVNICLVPTEVQSLWCILVERYHTRDDFTAGSSPSCLPTFGHLAKELNNWCDMQLIGMAESDDTVPQHCRMGPTLELALI